jgi:tyrosine-specific transport protein
MKKQLKAISLLAGTAIGTGMISLPIVLANFGIIGSLLLMTFFCWVTYVSAIIRCDLNAKSKEDFNLRDVGLFFGGRISACIGDVFTKILNFALLSAYIFGGASIIKLFVFEGCQFATVAIVFALAIAAIFLFSSSLVIKINNHAFIVMFSVIIGGIVCLSMCSKIESVPMQIGDIWHLKTWGTVLPVIFTSFGFQGSLHTLTKFVGNDKEMVRKACLFGSIIPACVYCLWVVCVLVIIFNSDQQSYSRMLIQPIEVSELIQILSRITNIGGIQHISWIVSFLAITTSIVGVGLALNDIIEKDLLRVVRLKEQARRIAGLTTNYGK